jgi:dGTPase
MIKGGDLMLREQLEALETKSLCEQASRSAESLGRHTPETPDPMRPAYQHDRDRVIHCKAFRRLSGKTQVFLAPVGDHYRTRMTHTLEVTQVGRTIARALNLNEMLVEAIGMGHDLGHTPFGHAGERHLRQLIPGGFHHVRQSLRVVESLARGRRGLNLHIEVLDGIAKHSKGRGKLISDNKATLAMTLEGQVLRLADIIAYVNHDFDDACRAGLMRPDELPKEIDEVLGDRGPQRLETLIMDVIEATRECDLARVSMSERVCSALEQFRDVLYERVYLTEALVTSFDRTGRILEFLWEYFMADEERFRAEYHAGDPDEPHWRGVADFVTGMTDRYALRLFEELFMPRSWSVL